MKEFDDIEQLFSSAFKDEAVTPPSSVKANINRKLFGAKMLRIVYILPLLLLGIVAASIFFYNQEDELAVTTKNTKTASVSIETTNKVHSDKKDSNKDNATNEYERNEFQKITTRLGKIEIDKKQDALLKQLTQKEKAQKVQKTEIDRIKKELTLIDLFKNGGSDKKDLLSGNLDNGKDKADERSEYFGEASGDEKTDTDKVSETTLRSSVSENSNSDGESAVANRIGEIPEMNFRPSYRFPYLCSSSSIDTTFDPDRMKFKMKKNSRFDYLFGINRRV